MKVHSALWSRQVGQFLHRSTSPPTASTPGHYPGHTFKSDACSGFTSPLLAPAPVAGMAPYCGTGSACVRLEDPEASALAMYSETGVETLGARSLHPTNDESQRTSAFQISACSWCRGLLCAHQDLHLMSGQAPTNRLLHTRQFDRPTNHENQVSQKSRLSHAWRHKRMMA